MRHLFGEKLKVTIETPDGKVIDMAGMLTDFSLSMDSGFGGDSVFDFAGNPVCRLPNQENIELVIRGIGPIVQSSRAEYVEKVRHAHEWRCPYCGHLNLIAARTCGGLEDRAAGCGAPRPFVYGELR